MTHRRLVILAILIIGMALPIFGDFSHNGNIAYAHDSTPNIKENSLVVTAPSTIARNASFNVTATVQAHRTGGSTYTDWSVLLALPAAYSTKSTNPEAASTQAHKKATVSWTVTAPSIPSGPDTLIITASAADASSGVPLSGSPDTDTFIVTTLNTPPIAEDDTVSRPENSQLVISVLANDTDPDGDSLIIIALSVGPANGNAVIDIGNTTITYLPNTSFFGTDSFSYSIQDGFGGSDTATVTISVGAVNDAPDAADDSASTLEDTPLDVSVLANDSDIENDVLSVSSVGVPQNGSAVLNPDNTITYSPDADFNGADSFTYVVSDGNGGTDAATVNITVDPVNDAPRASDDEGVTFEDSAVVIAVLANDSNVDNDSLTATFASSPVNGTVLIDVGSLTITYTPDANFNGMDMFDYVVSDGSLNDTGTVIITVDASNDSPVGSADVSSTLEDNPVAIDVLSNDSDADFGDVLSLISVAEPANGTATINSTDYTVIYTLDPHFNGVDVFSYTLSDGDGGTGTTSVTVTVLAVNDPPVAFSQNIELDEGDKISVTLEGSDVDADILTFSIVGGPLHGALTEFNSSSGVVVYTPNTDFSGQDDFEFVASDGSTNSTSATVSVTVNQVAEAADNNRVDRDDRNTGGGSDPDRKVYDERYLATNPSSRVKGGSFYLHDSEGSAIKEAKVGEAVDIRATIHNYQAVDQQYVFLVQICSGDNVAMAILYSSGTIADADATKVGIPWIPDQSGSYQIRIMIWTELSNPSPLTDLGMVDLRVQ